MREILFRGLTPRGKEWVYGDLLHDGYDYDVAIWEKNYKLVTKVYPETIGQYTGLTDKNGKKIFEGDIIKSDNGKQSAISVVKHGDYFPEMFYKMLDMFVPGTRHLPAHGFYAVSIDKGEEVILFQSPCVEVIGNIHDNPGLLEVRE